MRIELKAYYGSTRFPSGTSHHQCLPSFPHIVKLNGFRISEFIIVNVRES